MAVSQLFQTGGDRGQHQDQAANSPSVSHPSKPDHGSDIEPELAVIGVYVTDATSAAPDGRPGLSSAP